MKRYERGREEMEKLHNAMIRRYHTLCGMLRLSDEERMAMLSGYGVTSSKDMDTHDLLDLCGRLSKEIDRSSGHQEMDRWRKKVIASVSHYLNLTGDYNNMDIVKGIACRISGKSNFNDIPKERLRNIYYTFRNKAKDYETINSN